MAAADSTMIQDVGLSSWLLQRAPIASLRVNQTRKLWRLLLPLCGPFAQRGRNMHYSQTASISRFSQHTRWKTIMKN